MKKENYEAFLKEYLKEVVSQLDDVKKEKREQPDNDWWAGFAFGLRTAIYTMQTKLIEWHPNNEEEEVLQHFGINFDADEYIKR